MRSQVVPGAESLWTEPVVEPVGLAILCTVAYADVFDYALTLSQVHRYLIGCRATRHDVHQALNVHGWLVQRLRLKEEFVTLRGRGHLVEVRHERAELAADVWPLARRFARSIAALPFVRAVALTGALAMDNSGPGDDFDYLIVTSPGRLWLARAMVIGFVVKPAARRGHEVCPNYLLSERSLAFAERNLYVAHELAQMVPMSGLETYRRLRASNSWAARFLPNATGLPRAVEPSGINASSLRSLAELGLGTFVGGQLERIERRRKIRRFRAQAVGADRTCFSTDRCKGHFQSNEQFVQQAFAARLRALMDS